MASNRNKFAIMASFSFVNGWVDANCLLRYRCFATMMVGNMLAIGPAVSYHWFLGGKEEAFPDPFFLLGMLAAFMSGVALYRLLQRGLGVSASCLAPFIALWIVLHDILEVVFRGHNEPSRWNALRLAPVFGMQDAMTVKNGFGSLPWCTTNNIVTIAFGSADILLGGATDAEKSAIISSTIMFSFMVLGTVCGAAFCFYTRHLGTWHSMNFDSKDLGLMVIAVPLGCLFRINESRLGKPPQRYTLRKNVPTISEEQPSRQKLLEADPESNRGSSPISSKESKTALLRQLTGRVSRKLSSVEPVETDLHLSG